VSDEANLLKDEHSLTVQLVKFVLSTSLLINNNMGNFKVGVWKNGAKCVCELGGRKARSRFEYCDCESWVSCVTRGRNWLTWETLHVFDLACLITSCFVVIRTTHESCRSSNAWPRVHRQCLRRPQVCQMKSSYLDEFIFGPLCTREESIWHWSTGSSVNVSKMVSSALKKQTFLHQWLLTDMTSMRSIRRDQMEWFAFKCTKHICCWHHKHSFLSLEWKKPRMFHQQTDRKSSAQH